MKTLLHNSKLLSSVFTLFCLFFLGNAFGQSPYTSVGTGNWNLDSTWSGTGVPAAGDVVNIANGHTITVTANAAAASVTFTGAAATLTVNNTITLTVSGAVTLNNSASANRSATISGAGTLTCATLNVGVTTLTPSNDQTTTLTSTITNLTISGNLNLFGEDQGADQNNPSFNLQSGTVSVGGTINTDEENGSTVTLSLNSGAQSGTLLLLGATPFTDTVGSPTINANGTTATVNYGGATNQTVRPLTYTNLTLSGSGTKTLTSVASIGGNFTLSGTAITSAATSLTIGGNVTLGSGTSFTTGALTHNVAGNWVNNGATFTSTGSTINMNGTTQSIGGSSASTFNNLTLSTSGTKTFGIATPISSTLTINTGVVANLGTFTHSSNTLTLGGTGQLSGQYGGTTSGATFINSTFFATATGKINVAACGITGLWTGASSTNWATPGNWCDGVVPSASTNVTINSGGNQPEISAAAVCNSITLGSGSSLTINSTLGVSGNWTNNGSTVSGSGTVTLSGTATIGGTASTTFPNLSITGTVQQAINTSVSGNYNQTAGTYRVTPGATAYTLNISGNMTMSGGTFTLLASTTATVATTVTVAGNTTTSGTSSIVLESVNNTNTNGIGIFQTTDFTATNTSGNIIEIGLTGTYTNNEFRINGNLTKSGNGVFNVQSTSNVAGGIVFNKAGTQTFSYSGTASDWISYYVNSGSTLVMSTGLALGTGNNPYSEFTVNSGGTIDFGTNVISGGGTANAANSGFTLAAGATMITSNATGLQGSVTVVVKNFNSGANYEFKGAATGVFTLSTANTITGTMTINRSAGVTINQNFTATTLAFTDGIVTTGANAITIPAAGTITGASSTKYVNGKLNKVYASASSFFYPIGKGGNYRPLSFEYTTLTGTSTVSVEQIETALTGTLPASTNLNNSRTWDISQTGGSAFTYKVTLDGTGDAITGPVVMLKSESGTTTSNAVTTPDYTNTTGFTTLTGTNNFTLGSTCTVTSNAGTNQSFCDVTPVSLSANTPTYGTGAWTVSGPSSSSAQFSSTTNPTATFTPAGGNGVYTLTWTITNGNCADNTSITVDYGTVTTWTSAGGGSWDNGTPSATKAAIIEFDYTSAGDLNACSLTVTNNADVIILADDIVSLGGGLTVDTGSTFTLNSDAILLQGGTTNVNSGDITVIRETQALKRLDYVLWSSPVAGQNLGSFSPLTVSSRFYTYTTSSDTYTAIANTNDFSDGQGYLIRVPDNHPTTPTTWDGTFTGVPNSGNITIGLSAAANGYNAVGNPYPSPISISTFLSDNSSLISGNLYFWRKTNGAAGSAYVTYSGGAYDDGAHTYENIQPGQGFIVEANSAGSLAFNNLQREANNNTFYRNTDDAEASRIWLHLKSDDVIVGKMAVGYKTGATNELDSAFDGTYINDSNLALNSIVNGTELAVQHRAPFTAADIVPLSFKTNTAGTYTISINEVDGLFTDVEQNIYLKDNVLNSSHDLRTAPYSFATEAGVFANRFEIVYQAPLSVENPVFGNGVVVYSKDQVININTGLEAMATVKVYDIRGRLLTEKTNVNATTTTISLAQVANQVLIVQITAANGQTVSRKVVH